MDPAQLEADIAALTSAIAEEAGELDGASERVPSCYGYSAAKDAAHVASSRPSTEFHSHFENDTSGVGGCKVAFKGSDAQYPPRYLPQTQQQVYRDTGHGVEVPGAALSRGLSSKTDRHGQDQQDNLEQPSSLEHR